MGTWGSGNFDDDTAADHLSGLTGGILAGIEAAMSGDPVAIEPDEYWGVAVPCDVELLCLLAERGLVGVCLPAAATAADWKVRYLAVWDGAIDGLEPTPDYRRDRREVLVRTFDRLVELAGDRG